MHRLSSPSRRRRWLAPTALVLAAAASLSSPASAADALTLGTLALDPPSPTTAAAAGPFDPFAKGTWSLDTIVSGTWATSTNDEQDLLNGTVGFTYAPWDGVALSNELALDGIFGSSEDSDGFGGGFNLRVRVRLFEVARVSFFVDAFTGALQTSVSVPEHGSHFNFRSGAGLGAYVPIGDAAMLVTGAHMMHVSHAGLAGGDNPGYNGVQFYVGLTLPL